MTKKFALGLSAFLCIFLLGLIFSVESYAQEIDDNVICASDDDLEPLESLEEQVDVNEVDSFDEEIIEEFIESCEPLDIDELKTDPVKYNSFFNGVDYSLVYDYLFYINKHPDLKAAFGDDYESALAHFVNFGMREGRRASESFDVNSYRLEYSDLRMAFGSNLSQYYYHYINNGKRENRNSIGCTVLKNAITSLNGTDYSPVYDYWYYTNNYKDIKDAFGADDVAVLNHFIGFGMNEQRRGNERFDEVAYRCLYQDLRAAFRQNYKSYYMHYITNGRREGRRATGSHSIQNPVTSYDGIDISKIYDYNYYSSRYKSVLGSIASDDFSTMEYFINNGIYANHIAKQNYDTNLYQTLKAIMPSAKSAITSYLGFDFSPIYNYVHYAISNSDVVNALGYDSNRIFLHFIDYGLFEGRQGKAGVRVGESLYNSIKNRYAPYRFIHEKIAGSVFIGDSRVIDIAKYNNISPVIPYAQNNMGYQYMVNATNNSNGRLKIIMMGTNDYANIDAYLNFYRNRTDVILVTLGPVNDYFIANPGFLLSGYPIRDANMRQFNDRLKTLGKPMIDLYSFMVNSGYGTVDGVHYNSSTNQRMWQFIKNQLLI